MTKQSGKWIESCSGIILAGGRSTRFGKDKALGLWHGNRLIDHAAACLRGVCDEVLVVCRPEQSFENLPVDRVVFDSPGFPAGPLRGITAGLAACHAPAALVLSCDSPCVQPALLDLLLEKAKPSALAVVPEWKGCLQVLTALYRNSAANYFTAALEQGTSSPARALEKLSIVRVSEQECRRADPPGLSFRSINSPKDLERLEEKTGALEETAREFQQRVR